MSARDPSWADLLEVEWQAEWACIDADWARVLQEIEGTGGGDHAQGQPDAAGEAERPPRGPERGADEG